jgi:hypothetical protein
VIAKAHNRHAFTGLMLRGRGSACTGAARILSSLFAVALIPATVHAQLKDRSNPTSCLRMSQLQYLETLEQECQHLSLASNFDEIISSWHRACYLGNGPNRQSEDYVRWYTSNRSQQDQICRDAIEALRRNPRHFDGLLLYHR